MSAREKKPATPKDSHAPAAAEAHVNPTGRQHFTSDGVLPPAQGGHTAAPAASASERAYGAKKMTYEDASAERDKIGDQKDSLGAMSEQDQLALQQAMEHKGQLEEMISNEMKAGSESDQALTDNLKGS